MLERKALQAKKEDHPNVAINDIISNH